MSTVSSPLPESLDRIVQRFQRIAEPKRKYEQLLWFAKRLPPLPEAAKVPENKVPGCASQVYITTQLQDGKVQFAGDSDAQLVKGLVAILVEGLSGLPPQVVLQVRPDFIEATGLGVSLTPSRVNGFYNIFQVMQQQTIAAQQAVEASAN
jgi:cysteine desulfuration protein SufE